MHTIEKIRSWSRSRSFCLSTARRVALLAGAATILGISATASAQTAATTATAAAAAWPTRAVRIVVPFPPGGPADVLGRAFAQRLAEKWGQPVVIDNKGGANTLIGAQDAAHSPADGYTLFMPLDSTYTMNPALYSKLPYDPIKDFASISILATQALVLTANDRTPARSVKELITEARAQPGAINYGSSTTSTQLAGEMFTRQTSTKLVQVPYKGNAETVKAMLAGDVQVSFDGIAANVPHIKSGKIRALATTGTARSAALPEVPTMAEAGLPGYQIEMWNAICAPAGTPASIIQRINKDVVEIAKRPDVRDSLRVYGFEMVGSSPEQMNETIRTESARYMPMIKELGLRMD